MSERVALLSILFAAVAGLAELALVAPDYLAGQGFPLDDAWIHAVYGREIARAGSFAYNPGVPATGSTAPLWSAAVAVPHLMARHVGGVILLIKLLGFGLHVLMALLVYTAIGERNKHAGMRLAGAMLVAFHPDLIRGSVSGMEIPLAALAAVGLVCAAPRAGVIGYAALSAVAALARPELAVVSISVPFVMCLRRDRGRASTVAGAMVGNGVAFGLLATRNLVVSGLPLPATFYAKVGGGGVGPGEAVWMGFADLLGRVAIADSPLIIGALLVVSGVQLWIKNAQRGQMIAASAFLSGLLFCAVSFLLVTPRDPDAFYHQRYILPVVPLIVAPIPLLADEVIRWCLAAPQRRLGRIAFLGLLGASLVIGAPERFRRLANDARNVDDVQVAVGRFLAPASSSDVVWAVDAGAIRYFGNAFVVDMMGLNSWQLLGSRAQQYLDAHQPDFIEVVPGWSSLDEESSRQLRGVHFGPSTEYTVTSFSPMQNHWLVRCDPGAWAGRFVIGPRSFLFACPASEVADLLRTGLVCIAERP